MTTAATPTPLIEATLLAEQQRVHALNHSVIAGAPAVSLPAHTFKKPKRDFQCYGGNLEFWNTSEPHAIISGPAETGKTMALLHLVDHLAWSYPNLNGSIMRKVRADMGATVLRTWERKVIGMAPNENTTKDGIVKHGGNHPEFYQYPNGSIIWIGGLDRPGKALSGEPDVVAVNQTEELEEADWETLGSRVTGRGGVLSPGRLLGDCNPGSSTHWIKAKADAGTLRLIKSVHEDNPTLFNQETGEITPQGKISLAALDKLTGVRHKRLRQGLWVAAEGVVYEWDLAANHLVKKPIADIRYYIASVDWGHKNPGVIQVWGIDGDGRMYRVWEVYRTGKLVAASTEEDAWWINVAKGLRKMYNIRTFVCDPARSDHIEAFQKAGLPAKGAFNSIELGVQNVESRLKIQEDGYPRLMILRGSKAPADPLLLREHKPTCLEEEIEVYAWPKNKAGKPIKEVPVDDNNHACDAMRYAAAEVDKLGPDKRFVYA